MEKEHAPEIYQIGTASTGRLGASILHEAIIGKMKKQDTISDSLLLTPNKQSNDTTVKQKDTYLLMTMYDAPILDYPEIEAIKPIAGGSVSNNRKTCRSQAANIGRPNPKARKKNKQSRKSRKNNRK